MEDTNLYPHMVNFCHWVDRYAENLNGPDYDEFDEWGDVVHALIELEMALTRYGIHEVIYDS